MMMDNEKRLNGKQFGAILKRQEATEKAVTSIAKVLYLSELFKAEALTLDQYLEMMGRLGAQLGYDLTIGDPTNGMTKLVDDARWLHSYGPPR